MLSTKKSTSYSSPTRNEDTLLPKRNRQGYKVYISTIMRIIILLALLICTCSYAQEKSLNMVDALNIKKDIRSLDKRILHLVKKHPKLSKEKGIQIFYAFILSTEENKTSEEDYRSGKFLYTLSPSYRKFYQNFLYRKKYINTMAIYIADSIGNLLATASPRFIHIPHIHGVTDIEMTKMFHRKEVDFVFYKNLTSLGTLFAIKGNDVFIIEESGEGIKEYKLDEYVDCCYNKLFPFFMQ